jgi:hypothetical protein
MSKKKNEFDYPPLPEYTPATGEYPPPSKSSQGWTIIVAIIGAVTTLLAAMISGSSNSETGRLRGEREAEQRLLPTISALETKSAQLTLQLTSSPSTTNISVTPITISDFSGHVDGFLTDRSGTPIPDMAVSIRNGPQTKTDSQGRFVLDNVSTGSQLVIVQAAAGGEFSQNIDVRENQTTYASLVFDPQTTRLGLLSIVSPVDGGGMDIRKDVIDNNSTVHRATIYGRCDGLYQIFENGFDIWILIHSERDNFYWVQRPPAAVDSQDNTWSADIVLGSFEHPPVNNERWVIIAMATEPDSGFDQIPNTPKLSLLPAYIASNVVKVKSQITDEP